MEIRADYAALSHGSRQHVYSNESLYIDLKTLGEQQIVFAMNVSDISQPVSLNQSMFDGTTLYAWDLLANEKIDLSQGFVGFSLAPLSARYLLLVGPSVRFGDFDQDGDVDDRDQEILQSSFGTAQADANGDGTTSAADYVTWRKFSDQSLGGGASALNGQVPEPSAIALILVTITAICANVRRRES
jgi:hypothetical protein